MAQDENVSGTASPAQGVFGSLIVSGTAVQVRAIVLDSFRCTGTAVTGTIYVPAGVPVSWKISGTAVNVTKVPKPWSELWALAQAL